MSFPTFYYHKNGSVTPDRSEDSSHVMTFEAEDLREAENTLPYLDSRDIYALIFAPATGHHVVICDLEALRSMGMDDHLFIRQGQTSDADLEVIGVPLTALAPEIARYAELAATINEGQNVRIILFHDGMSFDAEPKETTTPSGLPSPMRVQKMEELKRSLTSLLVSPKIEIGPITVCWLGLHGGLTSAD